MQLRRLVFLTNYLYFQVPIHFWEVRWTDLPKFLKNLSTNCKESKSVFAFQINNNALNRLFFERKSVREILNSKMLF